MVRFVPMQPELFGLIPFEEVLPAGHIANDALAQTAVCTAPNVALAMMDGGEILGAAGVAMVSAWRGYAWMIAGAWMTDRHYALARQRCRAELKRIQASGLHRIEALLEPAKPCFASFVARMGFRFEGTMSAFTPDRSDVDLWAMTEGPRERHSPCQEKSA